MTGYASTGSIADVARALSTAQRIAIVSHARPDGDAAGSVLALARALRILGKHVDAILTGDIPPEILGLAEDGEVRRDTSGAMPTDIDLAVVVDTGAWNQLEPLDAWIRAMAPRVVGLDHHARGDDVAALRVVDPRAASTTQIVVQVVDALGVDISRAVPGGGRSIAEAAFAGLATDTGWFQFQNAGADAFALASRLIAAGVDRIGLYQALEETGRPQRLAVLARALQSLIYYADGRVAIMSVSHRDFAETTATSDDLGGVVNIPLEVASVGVSVLMTESKPGTTKVSFRSKARAGGAPWLNVSEFAAQFGGGGHIFAAGAKFAVDSATARATIAEAFERVKEKLL